MSDPRPNCPTCGKNDQVVENPKNSPRYPRFWHCMRCNTPIRKPRL